MKPVHDIKLAIQHALGTDQGKRELNKTSFRDNKTGKNVFRNSSMARAMENAIVDIPNYQDELMNKWNTPLPTFDKPKGKVRGNHPKEEYPWLRKRSK